MAIGILEIFQVLHRGHSALAASGQEGLEDGIRYVTVGSLNNLRMSHTNGLGPLPSSDADVIQGAHQCGHTS